MNIAKKVLFLTIAFSYIPLHSVYASKPVPSGQPLNFVQKRQIPQVNSPEYYFISQQNVLAPLYIMSQQNLLTSHQAQMQMSTHTNPVNSSPSPTRKQSHQNKEQMTLLTTSKKRNQKISKKDRKTNKEKTNTLESQT